MVALGLSTSRNDIFSPELPGSHLLIYSFNKYIMSLYYVPGIGNTKENETKHSF